MKIRKQHFSGTIRKLHLERGRNVYEAKKEGEPSFIKRVLYLNI
jgi:hypothetical protein